MAALLGSEAEIVAEMSFATCPARSLSPAANAAPNGRIMKIVAQTSIERRYSLWGRAKGLSTSFRGALMLLDATRDCAAIAD
jgi:hypothetical protein